MFKNPNRIFLVSIFFGIILLLPIVFNLAVLFIYKERIIPRIRISNYEVSGYNKTQVERLIREKLTIPEKIELKGGENLYFIPLREIGFSYNSASTFNRMYAVGRDNNYYPNSIRILQSFINPVIIKPDYSYDDKVFEEYISVISSQLSIEPVYPTLQIQDGALRVTKGSPGREVEINTLKEQLENRFSNFDFRPIEVSIKKIDPTLNSEQETLYLSRGQMVFDKKIPLSHEGKSHDIKGDTLIKFIGPKSEYLEDEIKKYIDEYRKNIESDPQNSVFTFKDGRVQEFVPSREGVKVKESDILEKIKLALSDIENGYETQEIQVPVLKLAPDITNSEVNNLGINELIGKGESYFKGSIPGRIHNVGLASSKINGVLVAPGDTFSFNNSVGDVSVLTGYKQAYIIQDGKTILGDGGGVCQVSTTLFRAVLNAGLPIVERAPHSYRVSYYEQNSGPGLDATVYSPTTDFKFKNDTNANILVQTIFDSKALTLKVEIYGTSDGRIATTTKPVITSSTPPPEDLYIDDPQLPVGTTKQVDYKAWGARVVFDYSVTRNGEVLQQKKFISNYKPWQAKFLRGTAPN